ncbi:hypothetical protein MTR_8g017430 [Medicago truncatula]|uniref:Uncharacterized protein n=1 Tax=Medicago truncatula TaxID=3880 RepID=A0A072TMJ1_MEDTR|nr:hypothetical protein MTR_8g017430 [Medicago truncatula]
MGKAQSISPSSTDKNVETVRPDVMTRVRTMVPPFVCSPKYPCLRVCNADDAKVIDWICTGSSDNLNRTNT